MTDNGKKKGCGSEEPQPLEIATVLNDYNTPLPASAPDGMLFRTGRERNGFIRFTQ